MDAKLRVSRLWILIVAIGIALFGVCAVIDAPQQAYAQQLTASKFSFIGNNYTVKFKSNDGTGDVYYQQFARGYKSRLTTCKFDRPGYVFKGWNTKANGKGKTYKDKASIKNLAKTGKTKTLYAQWKYRGEIAAQAALLAKKKHWTNRSRYHGLLYGKNQGDPSICSEFGVWCLYQAGARFGDNLMNKSYCQKKLGGASGKWSYSWKHVAFYRDNPKKGTVHRVGDGYIPQPGDLIIYVNSKHSGVTNRLKDARLQGANHTRICVKSNKSGKFWYVGGNGLNPNYIESGTSSIHSTSAAYVIHLNWERVTGNVAKIVR